MIKINDIKTSIVRLLKKTNDIDVYFIEVSKTDSNDTENIMDKYFFVDLIPINETLFGAKQRDKVFLADVAYINDNADFNLFYDWYEQMNLLFHPYIKIADRCITIENTNFRITESIGHYSFTLKFRDDVDEHEDGTVAENLNIIIKQEG